MAGEVRIPRGSDRYPLVGACCDDGERLTTVQAAPEQVELRDHERHRTRVQVQHKRFQRTATNGPRSPVAVPGSAPGLGRPSQAPVPVMPKGLNHTLGALHWSPSRPQGQHSTHNGLRPEGARYNSPGRSPGFQSSIFMEPCKGATRTRDTRAAHDPDARCDALSGLRDGA